MKPIIGISANHRDGVSCVADAYLQAVVAAGGVPLIIPSICDEICLEVLIKRLDGLILSGGGDINPTLFNEKALPQIGTVDNERDATELLLARLAATRQMPILGICRGEQLLNVLFGGTLYQDIETQTAVPCLRHQQEEAREIGTHYVTVENDSRLKEILGCNKLSVNSFHHQAIQCAAQKFRPVAFSEDGICEAIEAYPNHPIIGVQWHPENLAIADNIANQNLFTWLIEEAKLFSAAHKIHQHYVIIDSHCDTPMCFFEGIDLKKRENKVKVDFQKMEDGNIDAIFMATYIEQGALDVKNTTLATQKAFETIAKIKQQIAACSNVEQANTPQDILRLKQTGKRAVVLALENGYAIGNDIANVEHFFHEGIRYITLCHNGDNAICDSAIGNNTHNGLSAYGRNIVTEMNRLGIMVDLSHANEKSFFDAAAISDMPLILSHSSARAICNHPRNATDKQLRLLAEMGGVCQVCLYPPFLTGTDEATVQDAVNHIDYITNLIGIDFVGIGSDFDGGGGICGFQSSAEALSLTKELLRRGYSQEAIAKIWGKNLLRVMKQVQTNR
jgi:membrane dipeptidase